VVWTGGYAPIMFFMGAMMLPSATPTILLAAALDRKAYPTGRPYRTSGVFVARVPPWVGLLQRGSPRSGSGAST
jgi:predicted metal-binding membrane protein